MKKDKQHIEEEVLKTLESLDRVEKTSPKPFLYTRLKAKMDKNQSNTSPDFYLKPVYQQLTVTFLVVLVAVNIFTARLFIGANSETSVTVTEEESFFQEYYPTLTTIDNIEQSLIQ